MEILGRSRCAKKQAIMGTDRAFRGVVAGALVGLVGSVEAAERSKFQRGEFFSGPGLPLQRGAFDYAGGWFRGRAGCERQRIALASRIRPV
jgi:hypothetical protein